MKVVELIKENESCWDEFVETNPESTMYHLLGWKRILETTFGYKPFYLIALNDDNKIEGILPMFLMLDILRRKYLISNPFSNFAGICANTAAAKQALLEKAFEIARKEKIQYIELRQLREKVEPTLPSKESFTTLILEINHDADTLWKNLSSRNRGKVRKAAREGLTVDLGGKYLGAFHSIFAKNFKYLGTPVLPISYFEALIDEFSGRIELFVLNLNSHTTSGMLMFKFKNIIAEPWVASLREYNQIYVNNFLYWQAIKYACENNFKYFDFGRSTIGCGTYNFKLQWGAQPVPLYYQYYLNKAKQIPKVDALNNRYQRYINIWKKLPLRLTKFAGPRLVKYLHEF